jgi:hypothetical protein
VTTQRNWSVIEKEAYTLRYGLLISFKHRIFDVHRVDVFSDRNFLTYLTETTQKSVTLLTLLGGSLALHELNFCFKYHAGRLNEARKLSLPDGP